MDVRTFTVGPVQENCHIARLEGSAQALVIDPGDEADRAARRDRPARGRGRRDPAHAHALRPRRRRRARRPRDRRGGLVPGARGPGARGHHALRAVARLRPVRVLRRRPHGRRRRAAGARRDGDRRAVHARPLARPRHLPVPSENAAFSGDVLFAGSVGRTDLPGGDAATLMRSLGMLVEALPERDRRVPRPHGQHDDRPRARHQPVPGPAGVNRRIQAPRGTYDVLGEQALAREEFERQARTILERAGYERIETPVFEATELFARGVGESTDVVQKQMYSFEGGDSESITLRPGGHRAGLPRLHGARHAQAAAAGEALVPRPVLPPRAPAEGTLPPVLADRRARRSAPTTPPSTPR